VEHGDDSLAGLEEGDLLPFSFTNEEEYSTCAGQSMISPALMSSLISPILIYVSLAAMIFFLPHEVERT